MSDSNFILLAAVARRLDLHPALAKKLVEAQLIYPYRQIGRYFMFAESDLPRFAEAIKPALDAIQAGKGKEFFDARFCEIAAARVTTKNQNEEQND